MFFPDEHGEPVEVLGVVEYTEFMAEKPREVLRTIEHCVIDDAGKSTEAGGQAAGYIHADFEKLKVIAPPGTIIDEGDTVRIRGELYTVDHKPFDYSVGRRPVVRRHRPKVVFNVSRGDVHDHI